MDARFPVRYIDDRRVLKLTAEQFRLFVMATAWSVTNRTDGLIEVADIQLLRFATEPDARALVDAGLWETVENGWSITDFQDTQTGKAELERLDQRRRSDRERKARDRRAKAGSSQSVREEVREEVRGDVQTDRTGKARQGKERQGSVQEATSVQTGAPFWDVGFPLCRDEECSAQLLQESQRQSGYCPQHDGRHLMAAGS